MGLNLNAVILDSEFHAAGSQIDDKHFEHHRSKQKQKSNVLARTCNHFYHRSSCFRVLFHAWIHCRIDLGMEADDVWISNLLHSNCTVGLFCVVDCKHVPAV